ncbi:MAG: hypothetical protein QXF15_03295 [Candidatus Aenigmatarchaeota archaeon]
MDYREDVERIWNVLRNKYDIYLEDIKDYNDFLNKVEAINDNLYKLAHNQTYFRKVTEKAINKTKENIINEYIASIEKKYKKTKSKIYKKEKEEIEKNKKKFMYYSQNQLKLIFAKRMSSIDKSFATYKIKEKVKERIEKRKKRIEKKKIKIKKKKVDIRKILSNKLKTEFERLKNIFKKIRRR